ncbi:MAG: hypothetical protein AB1792_11150 [Candidatus Zixiibacteriota bacterium]
MTVDIMQPRITSRTALVLGFLVVVVIAPSGICHAATFGNTGLQTSTLNTENQITAGRFVAPSGGTADSITVYLDFGGDYDVFKIRCALYDYNDGTPALLDTSAELQVNCGVICVDGWRSFALLNHASLVSGATYDLCVWISYGTTDNAGVRVNSGQSGNFTDYQSATYGVWPSTLTESTLNGFLMSIYCTYTPGGTTGAPSRRRRLTEAPGQSPKPELSLAQAGYSHDED